MMYRYFKIKEVDHIVLLQSEACLELLVRKGAAVNQADKDGRTALHMAAIHGRMARTNLLISAGAEVGPKW
jgi:ankyrin repeat protein